MTIWQMTMHELGEWWFELKALVAYCLGHASPPDRRLTVQYWIPCSVCKAPYGGVFEVGPECWQDRPGEGRSVCRKPACQALAVRHNEEMRADIIAGRWRL